MKAWAIKGPKGLILQTVQATVGKAWDEMQWHVEGTGGYTLCRAGTFRKKRQKQGYRAVRVTVTEVTEGTE